MHLYIYILNKMFIINYPFYLYYIQKYIEELDEDLIDDNYSRYPSHKKNFFI